MMTTPNPPIPPDLAPRWAWNARGYLAAHDDRLIIAVGAPQCFDIARACDAARERVGEGKRQKVKGKTAARAAQYTQEAMQL